MACGVCLGPLLAIASVLERGSVVVNSLFIVAPIFVGFWCTKRCFFFNEVLTVLSTFAINSLRKREVVALF